MLIGLFRLRLGTGVFGLGRLLWTQVGRFPLLVCSQLTDIMSIHEGVIWFLLAIIAQLPMVVCL